MTNQTSATQSPTSMLHALLLPGEFTDLEPAIASHFDALCQIARQALADFAHASAADEMRRVDLAIATKATTSAVKLFQGMNHVDAMRASLIAIGKEADWLAQRALLAETIGMPERLRRPEEVHHFEQFVRIVSCVVKAIRGSREAIEDLVGGLVESAWLAIGVSEDAHRLADASVTPHTARLGALGVSELALPILVELVDFLRQLEAEDQLGQLG